MKYDSLLRGSAGYQVTRRQAGRWVNIPVEPASQGDDVKTTIDLRMQDVVNKALSSELTRTEAAYGTVILMEVKTGQVKAIANLERDAYGIYTERASSNHAVSDLMEPGSTFKTASIMVALEDGVCTLDEWVETGDGIYRYGGRDLRDHNYNKGGYGTITVRKAMEESSNIGVAKIILKGYENNPEKYVEGLYRLGLMEDLQIELPGAERPKIRKPSDKNRYWSKTSLPWMSFGYETQIPPIYTLAFYNAIANDGKMMRPYFVTDIMKDGKSIESFEPTVIKKSICSDKTLEAIRDVLRSVVVNGTGKPANSAFIPIAGKTGTAQVAENGNYGNGHAVSFAGYFPADKPEYSCIAVIRRPRKGYPSGGTMSGGVVKAIAEGIYAETTRIVVDKMKVDSAAVLTPHPKAGLGVVLTDVLDEFDIDVHKGEVSSPWVLASVEGDAVKLSNINLHDGLVPRAIGMGAKDALYLLENAGLRVSLEGKGRVTAQSLQPGQRFNKGQTVRLTLR
jgi:cell division protein FtsI (penicillin-binding protein 3)